MSAEDGLDQVALLPCNEDGDTYMSRSPNNHHDHQPRQSVRGKRISISFLMILAVLILQIAQVIQSSFPPPSKSTVARTSSGHDGMYPSQRWVPEPGEECGSSAIDAQEKGCVFDIMDYGWMPAKCYDKANADEAAARNPFPWYLDADETIPLNMTDMTTTPLAYTHWGYHIAHCRYAISWADRANRTGSLVPEHMVTPWHMLHCGMMLSGPMHPESMKGTRVAVSFNRCGKLYVPLHTSG
jgi:hypothetical protein